MEERKTIFSFLGSVLTNFGVCMIFMMVFSLIFGESAKGFSTMFALGNRGVPVETMAQFLLASAVGVGLRYLFFAESLFKNLGHLGRCAWMMFGEVAVIVVCIWVFGWFPVDMWLPLVMFVLSFVLCVTGSVLIAAAKERLENRKMEEALDKLKKEWQEEKDEK